MPVSSLWSRGSYTCFTELSCSRNKKNIWAAVRVTLKSVSRLAVPTLHDPMAMKPARLLFPWSSPGKNTGMDCHSLLQGIFLTQGSNPGLLHCRRILYHHSHQESPRITLNTEWMLKKWELFIICLYLWLSFFPPSPNCWSLCVAHT